MMFRYQSTMLNINYATDDDDALILINDVTHDDDVSILINDATDDDNVSITQPGQEKENKGQRHKHLVKEMALESTMLKMEEKNELNFNYSELP